MPPNYEEVSSCPIANTINGRAKSVFPENLQVHAPNTNRRQGPRCPASGFCAPEGGVRRVLPAGQLVALKIDALSRMAA